MKKIILIIVGLALLATMFAACKKHNDPTVVEQELITTLKVTVTDSMLNTTSFIYKVQNGFGTTTVGSVQIDTIKLHPSSIYLYTMEVLNESVNPIEDVTTEVLSEKDAHLFFFASNPATGAGAVVQSNGNVDNNNLPFNQSGKFTTGAAGNGTLTITLIHEPVNKAGTSVADAAGETDAEAIFPVLLQ